MWVLSIAREAAVLPEAAAEILGPIDVLGVTQVDRLECARLGMLSRRYGDQVDKVCHRASCLDFESMHIRVLLE